MDPIDSETSQGAVFGQHNKLLFKDLRLFQELSANVSVGLYVIIVGFHGSL